MSIIHSFNFYLIEFMNLRYARFRYLLFALLIASSLIAQNTTFSPEEKKAPSPTTLVKDARKVLVIPFEPRLYMSEIDQGVNRETKMNQSQIRNAFRSGLDFSIVSAFKKKYSVYSLLNDTGASGFDQRYIYESIAYNYLPLTDQTNPATSTDKKNTKKTDEDKAKIQNGQLTVTTSEQKKFMNVKITNPNLLTTLNKRYGAEVFVFVSQLDLKVQANSAEQFSSGNAGRTVGIHYSIYDLQGNPVAAGMAVQNFPAGLNNPNKIVNTYFAEAAQTILDNYLLAISPKPVKAGN